METILTQKSEISFINQSDDNTNKNVVIFQKNTDFFNDDAVAWKVMGDKHQHFTFSHEIYIAVQDFYGNVTPMQLARKRQQWEVLRSDRGLELVLKPKPTDERDEIEVRNTMAEGAIDVLVYRDGKLLFTKPCVFPAAKAVFGFDNTIWIGVVNGDIKEGERINETALAQIDTQISLAGITKANLVMTGGKNVPYKFTLVPTA